MTDTDTLNLLASYVPDQVVRRLMQDPSPPREPSARTVAAAVLYAGFEGLDDFVTRLEAQDRAQRAQRALDGYFWQFVDAVYAHGGDIVKSSGRGLLAMWPVSEAEAEARDQRLATMTHRAAECGLALGEALGALPARDAAEFPVTLRVGVSAGEAVTLSLGGSLGRWEFLLSGEPVVEARALAQRAQPGEALLSSAAWSRVEKQCLGQALPDGAFRLEGTRYPMAPRTQSPVSLTPEIEVALRTYVPGAVLNRLSTQQIGWLAEIRPTTVLFVNLPELAYTAPLEALQAAMRAMQRGLYRSAGSVSALHVDGRGMVLVAAFGLPPVTHKYDPAQALLAADALREALAAQGVSCAVGVATGEAYCGTVGNQRRREYTIVGAVASRAAALMAAARELAAGEGHVVCDAATRAAAQSTVDFATLPLVTVAPPAEPEETPEPGPAPEPEPGAEAATPWQPEPIPAAEFHQPDAWANINRVPHDQVSGVTYKRALTIKRVRYEPAAPAPEMPEPWQGEGPAVVRWLFSELSGTQEGLLDGARFAFLHDVTLPPGSSTGQRAQPALDKVLYVLQGEGRLYHRPTDGSPVVARPLRPGDAVLIRGGELHSLANEFSEDLRLIVLGLRREK